jgi:hypothetical protein
MKPHKHADLIKEWADGAKIEARYLSAGGWTEWQLQEGGFIWYHTNAEYRIKPEPIEDVIDYMLVDNNSSYLQSIPKVNWVYKGNANLKLTWDGETGKLKNAEVI